MKTIDITGDNHFEKFTKVRAGCRGIVIKDGKMLISHEKKTDYWMIPGGGLEEGETLEQCVEREILEETGYIAEAGECFLCLNEFYREYKFIGYYFVCEIKGEGEQSLTDGEKERGLVPEWLTPEEYMGIVSRYEDFALTNEEKMGCYFREYTAMQEWVKLKSGAKFPSGKTN